MNNPFSLEKGMELLEQGANTAKQQLNSTKQAVTGQVTGQQPSQSQPGGNPQVLDSFQEQIMGKSQPEKPALTTLHDQVMGESKPTPPTESLKQQILGGVDKPSSPGPSDAQKAQQKAQDDFMSAMYGTTPSEKPGPDQQALASKTQQDQQALKIQREYVQQLEQEMAQLRHQRVQRDEEEEKQEEQQKMQELQVEEKKKDDDIALRRAQNKAEVKGAGAG